jgi:hypothetical protein
MTGGNQAGSRPSRPPLQRRARRRWAIAGGAAVCWLFLLVMIGSAMSATIALIVIAGLAAGCVAGLRVLGITRDHPWLRRMASRPWRDGQGVLKVAMRHLADVFVITPSGALLAPGFVELRLNPDDFAFLCERMELGVINQSVTEVYVEEVRECGARLPGTGHAEVRVMADESVPPGCYRLRQGDPVGVAAPVGAAAPPGPAAHAIPQWAYSAPQPVYAPPAETGWEDSGPCRTAAGAMVTIMEPGPAPVPLLRLVTGSRVTQTRTSGARAGRGPVELVLPDVLTISREHASFTFGDGRWWITNQGRNGLTLNGTPVTGEQPLSDGDTIGWGASHDAPRSRVEIG